MPLICSYTLLCLLVCSDDPIGECNCFNLKLKISMNFPFAFTLQFHFLRFPTDQREARPDQFWRASLRWQRDDVQRIRLHEEHPLDRTTSNMTSNALLFLMEIKDIRPPSLVSDSGILKPLRFHKGFRFKNHRIESGVLRSAVYISPFSGQLRFWKEIIWISFEFRFYRSILTDLKDLPSFIIEIIIEIANSAR